MTSEKGANGVWEDITSQCTWSDSYINTTNGVKKVMVNRAQKLLWIAFCSKAGIGNQMNYVTVPSGYLPSYVQGWTHDYDGLVLVRNVEHSNGMEEAVVLNKHGQIRSSHTLNTATTESIAVNAMIPLV